MSMGSKTDTGYAIRDTRCWTRLQRCAQQCGQVRDAWWRRMAVAVAAMFMLAGVVFAQGPVDMIETWSAPGVAGWTNTTDDGTLSNPGDYLNMRFGYQGSPRFEADTARMFLTTNVLMTNITFGFKAMNIHPSTLGLYMHSGASGNLWRKGLPQPAEGAWVTNSVPVRFSEGWVMNSRSREEQFLRDIQSIDWVGVYVRRHSDISSQNYGIDNFRINGVEIPLGGVSIFGTLAYGGEQNGIFRVSADSVWGAASTSIVMSVPSVGPYSITGLPILTHYDISSYLDSNSNGVREFWEGYGEWSGNPADIFVYDLSNVDVTLTDPIAPDGMPYWWLKEHFDISEGGGGGPEPSYAPLDPDQDGSINWNEYRAGTDPNNPFSQFELEIATTNRVGETLRMIILRWDSIENRTYAVWRSSSLTDVFTVIDSGIPSTPPKNVYEDLSTTNAPYYFYRVEVE